MDYIKLAVMLLIGAAGGYMVPELAQKLIDYKAKQKNKEYPVQPQYLSMFCKVISAAVSMAGLGACAYFGASWIVLPLVAAIWLIGAVVFIVDMRIRIIANETVLALLILGLGFRILIGGMKGLPNSFITMIVIMVVWIILGSIMGFGKVGAGDVKLCGVIGFMFGYPNVIAPMLVMAVTMLVYCLIGLKTYRMTVKSTFPMGPFLVLGMLAGIPYMFYTMI